MDDRSGFLKHKELFGITLFFALTQGLIFLNDGTYFDAWVYQRCLEVGDWSILYGHWRASGLPVVAYLHALMGVFPSPLLAYKISMGLALYAGALAVYGMAKRFLPARSSALIAIIYCIYPASTIWMDHSQVQYVLFYNGFLILGFAVPLFRLLNPKLRVLARGLALALFTCFFAAGSLLCFYFGLLLYWFLLEFNRESKRSNLARELRLFVSRNWDFVLLPFVYWKLSQKIFPPYGEFQGYNQPAFHFRAIAVCLGNFWQVTLVQVIHNSLSLLISGRNIFVWICAAGLAPVLLFLSPKNPKPVRKKTLLLTLAFGLALFFFGAIGYAAVEKFPEDWGWRSRYSLLVSLPIGVLLVAFFGMIEKIPRVRYLGRLGLAVLLIAFTCTSSSSYLIWQARWVRDRGLIDQLGQTSPIPSYSTLVAEDASLIGGEGLRIYEWGGVFRQAFKGKYGPLVVYNLSAMQEWLDEVRKFPFLPQKFMVTDFKADGPIGLLVIKPHYRGDERWIALRYLFYRATFRDPRARELADGMVQVAFQPGPQSPSQKSGD